MTTHRVAELEGALLDAAVAKAEGWFYDVDVPTGLRPSTDWGIGGPIIQREQIELVLHGDGWSANPRYLETKDIEAEHRHTGPTPLIAAMRAYVASKFGETVELT